jgi:hypothetical protein
MQHSNLRHWKVIVWVLAPAVIAHELVHGLIADRWADVEIDWSEPAAWMYWPQEPPTAGYLAAFLAPMVVGYAGAAGVGLAALSVGWPSLPLGVWIWIGANWLYFSFPTASDLSAISDVVATA